MSKVLRLEVQAQLYYAWLNKPSMKSGKYQVVLAGLDANTIQRVKDWGANVVTREGMGITLTVKNPQKVRVVDSQGNELPDSVLATIGNGTTANVKIAIIPSSKGHPAQCLDSVQIIKLVEYIPANKTFAKQEGYVVAAGGNIIEDVSTVVEDTEWDDTVND